MNDETSAPGPDREPSPSPAKTTASFAELGLRPEVLQAITDMGFTDPMEVQTATIGLIREGRDLMVQSRTGSGKTAAFGIPLVDSIVNAADKYVQAITLLPTRELALQVAAEIARLAAHTSVQVVPVYGGAPMGRQIEQLKAGGQMVCGTPGRVLDHIRRGTLKLDRVKCVVLDECDEMLSMGFQEDIETILERTPAERQTLLFSATVPEGIQRLSRRFMRNAQLVVLSADFIGVHEIRHVYYSIPGGQREAELTRILAFENPARAIIFCNTREETSRLAEYLRRQGYDAEAISSDLSQADRERVMARMRAGGIRFLVATDVAARGIDLENLPCVINYTIPESPEVYIHRTGRTGRAGRHGTAISLVGPTEVGSFYYIKLLYKIRPEERSLPSEAEIRSRREGERVTQLRALLPGEPAPPWRALARRVIGASDGERLIAALLGKALGDVPAAVARPPVPVPREVAPREVAPREAAPREAVPRDAIPPQVAAAGAEIPGRDGGADRTRERVERGPALPRDDGFRPRDHAEGTGDGRDRPPTAAPPAEAADARGPREAREQGRFRGRDDRGARRADPRGGRAERERRGRGGPAGAGRPPSGGSGEAREFWEVWSEEVGRTAPGAPPTEPAAPLASPAGPDGPGEPLAAPAPPAAGQARLYLNLGRKDGASDADVAALLAAQGLTVPPPDIEVMNTHTYVNVAAADAERLCAALSGKEHGARTLLCEPARPPKRR
jgi:ATP-dependent RNA helicase DeaD